MSNLDYVYFMFSDIEVNEENVIAKKEGKRFKCGNVSAGGQMRQFSKKIKQSQLKAFCNKYPDAKIQAKGYEKDFKWDEPVKEISII